MLQSYYLALFTEQTTKHFSMEKQGGSLLSVAKLYSFAIKNNKQKIRLLLNQFMSLPGQFSVDLPRFSSTTTS